MGSYMNVRHILFRLFVGCAISFMPINAAAESKYESHSAHRHHVSIFTGGTAVFDDDHTGLTYGVDYEYVLSPRFGIGAIVERAEGDVDATSVIALIDIHISERLVFQAGPGIEFENDDEIVIGRIGAYYEFHLSDNITISPSLGYDISEKADALVFGVLVGRKF